MTVLCGLAALAAGLCSTPDSRFPPPPAAGAAVAVAPAGFTAPALAPAPHPPAAFRGGRPPRPPAADAWLGEDKLQHMGASFAATTLGYGVGRLALDAGPARVAAGAAAGALGVGKEVRDRRSGGGFSVRDLVWDAAGIALGMALIRAIP